MIHTIICGLKIRVMRYVKYPMHDKADAIEKAIHDLHFTVLGEKCAVQCKIPKDMLFVLDFIELNAFSMTDTNGMLTDS